jgi:hypothetical protein
MQAPRESRRLAPPGLLVTPTPTLPEHLNAGHVRFTPELATRLSGYCLGYLPAAAVADEPGGRAHATVLDSDADIVEFPISPQARPQYSLGQHQRSQKAIGIPAKQLSSFPSEIVQVRALIVRAARVCRIYREPSTACVVSFSSPQSAIKPTVPRRPGRWLVSGSAPCKEQHLA